VGLLIPGLIIFFYLLVDNRWSILRTVYLIPGALLFLALVSPWYLLAEARNAGFLRYFLWDEHFGRFATTIFDRDQPWYFFWELSLLGFFPGVCCFRALLNATGRNRWMAEEFFCYHGASYR
jgi:4-amino-4-deoxy-L-arabinose transferase-like glycosyltransferase